MRNKDCQSTPTRNASKHLAAQRLRSTRRDTQPLSAALFSCPFLVSTSTPGSTRLPADRAVCSLTFAKEMKRTLIAGLCLLLLSAITFLLVDWLRLPNVGSVVRRIDDIGNMASVATISDSISNMGGYVQRTTPSADSHIWKNFPFSERARAMAASTIETRIPIRRASIFNEFRWAAFAFDASGRLIEWKYQNWVVAF